MREWRGVMGEWVTEWSEMSERGEEKAYTVMLESSLASFPENSFNESHKRTRARTVSLRPTWSHRDLQNSNVDV